MWISKKIQMDDREMPRGQRKTTKIGKEAKERMYTKTQCSPHWYLTSNILSRQYSQYLMNTYLALIIALSVNFFSYFNEMILQYGLSHSRPGRWFSAASSRIIFQGHRLLASAYLDNIFHFCVIQFLYLDNVDNSIPPSRLIGLNEIMFIKGLTQHLKDRKYATKIALVMIS